MWDLIVSFPDHCLSFYFDRYYLKQKKGILLKFTIIILNGR